ncbi:MAG: restriction endonuclease [Helicobacteraceae bacterium]|jgi:hypothetical protein|nr:restriction endonuclease [Helicobacteraceae bacterium]
MIPTIINNICEYLSDSAVALTRPHSDGRVNAYVNEGEILDAIRKRFRINVPRNRSWFDFSIGEQENFYPINIKVIDTTRADNLNCKLGIYYALTGQMPSFQNEIGWLDYFEKLRENMGKNQNKDYYFLVCNKQNVSDIFANSLKGIRTLQPNGNNLPFQCKWDDNREAQERSFNEAKEFILSAFGKSIKLRSEIYFNFRRLFP